jgi:low temperature requirement protein LtrA
VRLVLFAGMILTFIVALALPEAFGDDAALFAVAYAGVRMLHLGLYADASRRGDASWASIAGFAVTVVVGMALLIAGAVLEGTAQTWLWVAAAAIDYAGPALLTRERLRGLQRVAVAHFAERYGLFIIICLGESIIAIGVGAEDHALDAELIGAVALASLVTIGLWWAYFDRVAGAAEERLTTHEDPVLAAADAYSYLHLLLVAGIIVTAIGLKTAVGHPGDPLGDGARLALFGGVALYLLGHAAFVARLLGGVQPGKIAAAIACALLYLVTGDAPAWLTVGLLAGVLVLLAVAEQRLGVTSRDVTVGAKA